MNFEKGKTGTKDLLAKHGIKIPSTAAGRYYTTPERRIQQ